MAVKSKRQPHAPPRPHRAADSPGTRMCEFVESYIIVPDGYLAGTPLKLEPFQREFIHAVYDNPHTTRRAILSMARKNAKTTTVAALVLGHLVGPAARLNAQIVSGAMSREQASLVFNLAAQMIMQNEALGEITRIVPSGRRIQALTTGAHYKALAAEGATAMGISPMVVILDEVGQVKGPSHLFIDSLITSQGAHRDPMQFVISTQAPGDGDLLSIWIDDALKGADKKTVCHLYAAENGCELDDPKAWRAANPGLGTIRSTEDLRSQIEQAMRLPSMEASVRNLLLNQRVSRVAPFLSPSVWAQNAGPIDPELFRDGRPIYGGLDLSARQDLTAMVLSTVADDGHVHQLVYAWTPLDTLQERARRDRVPYDVWNAQGQLRALPGKTLDYDRLVEEIGEITDGMTIVEMAFDRWRIDVFKSSCERMGVALPLVEYGQGFKDMSAAVDELESLALRGALRHGDHPVYTSCVANTGIEMDASGNRKPTKAKSWGRIDACVASLMSVGAMGKVRDKAVTIASLIG